MTLKAHLGQAVEKPPSTVKQAGHQAPGAQQGHGWKGTHSPVRRHAQLIPPSWHLSGQDPRSPCPDRAGWGRFQIAWAGALGNPIPGLFNAAQTEGWGIEGRKRVGVEEENQHGK